MSLNAVLTRILVSTILFFSFISAPMPVLQNEFSSKPWIKLWEASPEPNFGVGSLRSIVEGRDLLSANYDLPKSSEDFPFQKLSQQVSHLEQTEDATTGSSSWQMVGQVGGPVRDMAVQGTMAYVAIGLRLVVLDVSNPANPYEVGSTMPFPHFAESLVISGTTAYVAAGSAGLRVVDISNPSNPTEIGSWDSPGYAEGVAVAINTVYLADGPYGLRILDASDPSLPIEVGCAYPLHYGFDVAVEGEIAYLAAGGAGLLMADISNPANPLELNSFDTPGYVFGIHVTGSIAYVADGWEGLRIVDISDPQQAVEVGSSDTLGWAMDLDVSDSVAYIADGGNGLLIVDVSDKTHPVEIGVYEISGVAVAVAFDDDTVYVADERAGLHAIDVSNVLSPTSVSLHSPLADAYSVAVQGDYAYVSSGFAGMYVIDISDPQHPYEVARYVTGSYAASLVVSGTYAYLGHFMPGSHRLHVIDISEPTTPTNVGVFGAGGYDAWWDIEIKDGVIFAADEWGLRLVDVSDPANPTQISFIELAEEDGSYQTSGVALYDDIAYVSAFGRLNVVGLSDISNPVLLAVHDDKFGLNGDMTITGDRGYMAGGFDGILVTDLYEPITPTVIGDYVTPGSTYRVAVSGTLAFVSDAGGGVQIVDVSIPFTPTLVSSYNTPGDARYTVVRDNYVYIADGSGGLIILQEVSGFHQQQMRPAEPSGNSTSPVRPPSQSVNLLNSFRIGEMARRDKVANYYLFEDLDDAGEDSHSKEVTEISTNFRPRTNAEVCTVTSASDSGSGTLRWCIEKAAGGDMITFSSAVFSSTDPQTIHLISELPPLSQSNLTIDASNAGVILDGGGSIGTGLYIDAGSQGNTVKGLQILNFASTGIWIEGKHNTIGGSRVNGSGLSGEGNLISANEGAGLLIEGSNNIVIGNLIGTDISGKKTMGNEVGIGIRGPGNRVGGETPDERNIISGNLEGIGIVTENARGNLVIGNYIGTDITGANALGNSDVGILIEWGSGNTIKKNVISGNCSGINLVDQTTIHNAIIGNYIGTDATGTLALGNKAGIGVGCSYNRIGGTSEDERNIISGNETYGIVLGNSNAIVTGNYVGTDVHGEQLIPNHWSDIDLTGAYHNFIGGVTEAERNVIGGSSNGSGFLIRDIGTEYNWLGGNIIGANSEGTIALGGGTGIMLQDYAAHNFFQSNVISGNDGRGVWTDTEARSNVFRGNKIGVAMDGLSPLPNGSGMQIDAASNTIGGEHRQDGNIVAFNKGSGLGITGYSGNTINHNSIYANVEDGIVLENGGNNLLASPVITDSSAGSFSGTACAGCIVELFSDTEDEGRVFEGATTTNDSGAWTWVGSLNGPHVTTTATDPDGNTSAFSSPGTVVPVPIVGLEASNSGPTVLGQATRLTAIVTAGANVSYTWFFGDGSSPITRYGNMDDGFFIDHTYPVLGTYTAVVTASNSLNMITDTTAVTILSPTVDFGSATYHVGEGAGSATMDVVLSTASGLTASVAYSTTNGTATAGEDYTAISGTLTFPPGVTSQSFDVVIVDDAIEEGEETVTLALANAENATIGGIDTAQLNIIDDDGQPTIRFSAPTYDVNESAGSARITTTLNIPYSLTVTVDYATLDGTAIAGSDYITASGTLSFPPGVISQAFTVLILDDALEEDDETLDLTLSHPVNSTLLTAESATLTIQDDDGQFAIYLPLVLRIHQ